MILFNTILLIFFILIIIRLMLNDLSEQSKVWLQKAAAIRAGNINSSSNNKEPSVLLNMDDLKQFLKVKQK